MSKASTREEEEEEEEVDRLATCSIASWVASQSFIFSSVFSCVYGQILRQFGVSRRFVMQCLLFGLRLLGCC